ncbi:MAG: hypothetical protein IJT36_08255 [Alphaproteobacteria bacterium]|nr:hypothetical protein [Alphaproteobacteria bacterium]
MTHFLLDTNKLHLKNNLDSLITKAVSDIFHHQTPANKNIIINEIKLVILHIHTTMDPCEKCARILVGLSHAMNSGLGADHSINKILSELRTEEATIGTNIFSKFLVEVSSRKHYSDTQCNHVECAGRLADHDVDYAASQPNIILGDTAMNFTEGEGKKHIAIPFGSENEDNNWYFQTTFPPYVIFCRLQDPAGLPEHNEIQGCPNSMAENHSIHQNHITNIPINKPN